MVSAILLQFGFGNFLVIFLTIVMIYWIVGKNFID